MARTAQEIAEALALSISNSDPTIDTEVGPIYDLFVIPVSGQLTEAETAAEELRQLFTLQFSAVITDDEMRAALGNFGSTPGEGKRSRHLQYFMRFTRPSADVEIPAGTLVTNADGSLVYRLLNSVTIVAAAAAAIYNPSRNTYEVSGLVEATGTGPQYELPAYRVNSLLTTIAGIDSTENRTKSRGGTQVETKDEQAARFKNSLLGINLGAPGGLKQQILDTFSTQITDVSVVQPFSKSFKRMIAGPALDIYILGSSTQSITETFIATSGQTQIVLTSKPALSVSTVTVNGSISTAYSFSPDTSFELGRSLRGQDLIVFITPLIIGDEIVVTYEYNSLIEEVHSTYFYSSDGYLFNTDIMVRAPVPIYPVLKVEVKILSSYTDREIQQNLDNYFISVFNPTTFIQVLYPEVVRQNALNQIPGIQSMRFTVFRRSSGATADIEPILMESNEQLVYDTSLVTIGITR